MDKTRIAYLIQRFRSRQATREEIAELDAFWQQAQHDDTLFNVMSDEEKEATRLAMLRRIKRNIGSAKKSRTARHRNLPVLSWTLRIAASVAILVALAIFYVGNPTNERTYMTTYGEQLSVQLPDGSSAILNGNSRLRHAPLWDGMKDREVWVDGEAFFEVVHTENDQRFIVHTVEGMDVQVLGTKFNVKVRRGKAEVMLQEGKVRLEIEKQASTERVTLVPGELVTLVDEQVSRSKVRADVYTAWKENRLIFDETPLRDIAIMLEDTYGLRVEFKDKALSTRKLSGEIIADNSDDILNAIKETMGITVLQDDNSVVFTTSEIKAN